MVGGVRKTKMKTEVHRLNDIVKDLKNRVIQLETIIEVSKTKIAEENHDETNKKNVSLLKCNSCAQIFDKLYYLECHIKTVHKMLEHYKCDQCNKKFFSNERLIKHKNIHSEAVKKNCYYFNNEVECPYEEFGCKYIHVQSDYCKRNLQCKRRLCSYRHAGRKMQEENSVDKIVEDIPTDIHVQENSVDKQNEENSIDTIMEDNILDKQIKENLEKMLEDNLVDTIIEDNQDDKHTSENSVDNIFEDISSVTIIEDTPVDNQIKNDSIDNHSDKIEQSEDSKPFERGESFYYLTSTPQKSSNKCEDCLDILQCVYCIAKHMLRRDGGAKTNLSIYGQ